MPRREALPSALHSVGREERARELPAGRTVAALAWPRSVPRGGRAPGPEWKLSWQLLKGAWGPLTSWPFEGQPRMGNGSRWAAPRGSGPYLFLCSSSRFAAFHSEPCGQGEGRSPSAPTACPYPPAPRPAAHQVEVGEDAGGPVLLSHQKQHLVVDEVTVLLEGAPQA